ncbi:MAG TPA: histidine kinase, partial [Myxococcales bacterium]|nr:histidine kinase [Myxococcales bacterium]
GRRLSHAPTDEGPRLEYLASVVETLDGSVRRFIDRLREPRALPPLARSLEELIAPLRERSGLALSTAVELEQPLPALEREAIYRLVQEALTNVFKHAEASEVRVSVRGDEGGVMAEVLDDGRGFDPEATPSGWGLRGLRERAEALGGELDVQSGAGGTAVRLRVPLEAASRPLKASA